jgi:hypothetical protein
MLITDFSPNDLKGAMCCCAFSTCSNCPLSESSPLVGKALCDPNNDTSKLFNVFAEYLAKHVLEHSGNEVVEALILKAIKDMYHVDHEEDKK